MSQPSPDVVYRRLGDAAMLVHLGTNEIFELNDTGARIWELLGEGRPPDAIVDRLADEFHVDRETARLDCDRLLTELRARKLIHVP